MSEHRRSYFAILALMWIVLFFCFMLGLVSPPESLGPLPLRVIVTMPVINEWWFTDDWFQWLKFAAIISLFLVSFPTFIGTSAALFTAHDVATSEYGLLTLTNLSDRQLFMGYWRASVNRFMFGVGLFTLSLITIIITSLFLYFLAGLHLNYKPSNLSKYTGLLWMFSMMGMVWVCHAAGIWAGLAIRRYGTVTLIMIVMGVVVTFIWAWVMMELAKSLDLLLPAIPSYNGRYEFPATAAVEPAIRFYTITALGFMPYLLTVVAIVYGPRFARN